jgi:hypothetical protein
MGWSDSELCVRSSTGNTGQFLFPCAGRYGALLEHLAMERKPQSQSQEEMDAVKDERLVIMPLSDVP